MKRRYLEVTYRRGKALAAYLYFPRATGAKAQRSSDEGKGIRLDYDTEGNPIGLEITSPGAIGLEDLNEILRRTNQPELTAEEWAPAEAA